MEISMREVGKTVKNMEKVYINILIVVTMKVNLIMMSIMVKGSENGEMVIFMRGVGKMVK
jgi:hypothetical protein